MNGVICECTVNGLHALCVFLILSERGKIKFLGNVISLQQILSLFGHLTLSQQSIIWTQFWLLWLVIHLGIGRNMRGMTMTSSKASQRELYWAKNDIVRPVQRFFFLFNSFSDPTQCLCWTKWPTDAIHEIKNAIFGHDSWRKESDM